MKYLLLTLLLLFASCNASRLQEVTTQDSRSASLVLDPRAVANPDSLSGVKTSTWSLKSLVSGGKKIKLKNTTVVVQAGENNVASPTGKVKAPQAIVSGDNAQVAQIQEPKNSVITTGDNSPASQVQPKKASNWFLLMALGAGAMVVLYVFLKRK